MIGKGNNTCVYNPPIDCVYGSEIPVGHVSRIVPSDSIEPAAQEFIKGAIYKCRKSIRNISILGTVLFRECLNQGGIKNDRCGLILCIEQECPEINATSLDAQRVLKERPIHVKHMAVENDVRSLDVQRVLEERPNDALNTAVENDVRSLDAQRVLKERPNNALNTVVENDVRSLDVQRVL